MREHAFATCIWDSGSRVGAVIALPIVAGIVALLHWRAVFLIIGRVGIIWAIVGWRIYHDPSSATRANAAEIEYIEAGRARTTHADVPEADRVKWSELFATAPSWR